MYAQSKPCAHEGALDWIYWLKGLGIQVFLVQRGLVIDTFAKCGKQQFCFEVVNFLDT